MGGGKMWQVVKGNGHLNALSPRRKWVLFVSLRRSTLGHLPSAVSLTALNFRLVSLFQVFVPIISFGFFIMLSLINVIIIIIICVVGYDCI